MIAKKTIEEFKVICVALKLVLPRFLGILAILSIPALLLILVKGCVIKALIVILVASIVANLVLLIKTNNNPKSEFYVPNQYSPQKRLLKLLLAFLTSTAITFVAAVLFMIFILIINSQGDFTQWGQSMYGQP